MLIGIKLGLVFVGVKLGLVNQVIRQLELVVDFGFFREVYK